MQAVCLSTVIIKIAADHISIPCVNLPLSSYRSSSRGGLDFPVSSFGLMVAVCKRRLNSMGKILTPFPLSDTASSLCELALPLVKQLRLTWNLLAILTAF